MRLRTADPAKLNSLTQYPSIQTYHALDPKTGGLLEAPNTVFMGDVLLTEKVDGTNARITISPGGEWLIGSREEWLTADGDFIYNTKFGIVDVLRPLAERLATSFLLAANTLVTFYLEVYGANIGQFAKNYTTSKEDAGFRLFDVAYTYDSAEKLTWDREKIATWRDTWHAQEFVPEWTLRNIAAIHQIPRVPVIAEIPAGKLPLDVDGMHDFLKNWAPETLVKIDETGRGRAEGLVVRSFDRTQIAKIRYQNYDRTVQLREQVARAATRHKK